MDAVFTERKGDVSIIHLNGRFDASSSAHIHDKIMTEIENEECTNLILNFEKVDYISSAGLRIAIYVSKNMKKLSGNLVICCLNNNIKKIFEISGLYRLFKVAETLDEALKLVEA